MRPLILVLVFLSACNFPGVHHDPRSPAEVCSAALRGTKCDLLIAKGRPPVVSHCWKHDDGSLECISPEQSGSTAR